MAALDKYKGISLEIVESGMVSLKLGGLGRVRTLPYWPCVFTENRPLNLAKDSCLFSGA